MAAIQVRYDLDRDVRTVQEMAGRLVPYVYENELYGAMPNDLPNLTVGGLLMRLQRLEAISNLLQPRQKEALKTAQANLDKARKEWTVALEGKVDREFTARMKMVEQFINECAENPKTCAENYPNTAEKRLMLQVLAEEAARLNMPTDHMKNALAVLDNKLNRHIEKGAFIWDERLKAAYPSDKYWFLYIK